MSVAGSVDVEALGARAAEAAADRLAATLRSELPGVTITRSAEGIEISGRDLRARLFDEPALRWPGGLVR